ncbi:MAG: linear amide C-N hydrolase [Myxococcaceae bacterium]
MRPALIAAVAALALLASARPALACTAFLLERGEGKAMAKEYDWSMGQGLVMSNPAGIAKQALTMKPGDKPAKWLSRHASLTFNQYGRELPNGGMNEAGLMMEVLWYEGSTFPKPDERPTVSELQFVQWVLDNFASVDELLTHVEEVRVSRVYGAVHYLTCDKSGACAALEFIGGKLTVASGKGLVSKALTNTGYSDSARYLARHAGFGGKDKPPAGMASLARFVRASARIAAPAGPKPSLSDEAFAILDSVKMGEDARWHIVYVPSELKVYFRTSVEPKIRWVSLGSFERACSAPARVLDIDANVEGEAFPRFSEYTEQANQRLVEKSLGPIKDKIPPGAIQAVAHYPAMLPCTTKVAPPAAKAP